MIKSKDVIVYVSKVKRINTLLKEVIFKLVTNMHIQKIRRRINSHPALKRLGYSIAKLYYSYRSHAGGLPPITQLDWDNH